MKQYVKVVVRNNSIYTDNLFTYKVPEFLIENIQIGHRVLVPFGMYNKPVEAFVFDLTDELEQDIKLKNVVDLLDEEPIFNSDDINLILWMKNKYLCTYIDCINLLYPKGYKLNNYKVISLIDNNQYNYSKTEQQIIDALNENGGKVKLEKLKKIKNINNIIYKLQQKNIVKVEWEYKDHKNEKKIQIISLALDKDIIDEYIINNKIRLGNKQKEIIDFLKKFESIDRYNLQEVLKTSKATIDSLLEKQLINIEEIQYYRKPNEIYKVEDKNIDLNEEQAFVTSTIKNNMFDEDKKPYMIHGVTGSGKTEVYMDIIKYSLSQGLDSIVLVP